MPSAAAILFFASFAYHSLAAPVDIPARDVSYDDGQYHWTATNLLDDGQWHPQTADTGAPDLSPSTVAVVVPSSKAAVVKAAQTPVNTPSKKSQAPVPTSFKESQVPAHAPSNKSQALVPTSLKESQVPAHTPSKKSQAPVPTSFKKSQGPAHSSSKDATPSVHLTFTAAAPSPTKAGAEDKAGAGWTAKKALSGDGSNWPTTDQWVSFEAMWSANQKSMKSGCTGAIQNSAADIQAIKDGITSESKTSGVDERFILAVIMQESHGCVRVGGTNNGVQNPGIMQDHNGKNNCAGAAAGACSAETIAGMIKDGTSGTASGNGLKQEITLATKLGAKGDSQEVYWASRLYNSGDSSYKAGDDLSSAAGATASYSSDIANRLMGVVF